MSLLNYYTDVWSTGCVMAELMLGHPLFPGESGIDQLVEIIKVLGTPTREQIKTMNPNYMEHKFPQIKPHPFSKVIDFIIFFILDFFANYLFNKQKICSFRFSEPERLLKQSILYPVYWNIHQQTD